MSNRTLGAWGERIALAYLIHRGYRPIARGWRCGRLGEIDIVMTRGRVLAFVEVKTRRGVTRGSPEEAVDLRKQRRLCRLAAGYRASLPPESPLLGYAVRMDVVAVEPRGWCGWQVRHHPGAFDDRAGFSRRRG